MRILQYAVIAACIWMTGCAANRTRLEPSGQIQVFGIQLYSDIDYKEINGVAASEEPCLKGSERSFDALDLVVGYGFDGRIRKIHTRNRETSLFGIAPGITAEEGARLALKAGLREVSESRYQGDGFAVNLLIDGNRKVFGITVEAID